MSGASCPQRACCSAGACASGLLLACERPEAAALPSGRAAPFACTAATSHIRACSRMQPCHDIAHTWNGGMPSVRSWSHELLFVRTGCCPALCRLWESCRCCACQHSRAIRATLRRIPKQTLQLPVIAHQASGGGARAQRHARAAGGGRHGPGARAGGRFLCGPRSRGGAPERDAACAAVAQRRRRGRCVQAVRVGQRCCHG